MKLKVHVSGLVMLVRVKESDVDRRIIVLPIDPSLPKDAKKAKEKRSGKKKTQHHHLDGADDVHDPILSIRMSDVEGVADRVITTSQGEQFGLWELRGYRLKIVTKAKARELLLREVRLPDQFKPDCWKSCTPSDLPYDHDDVSWVPDLARVSGPLQLIDGALTEALIPAPAAARLELEDGVFTTAFEPGQEEAVFYFKNQPKTVPQYEQAMTDCLKIAIKREGVSDTTLTFTRANSDVVEKSVVLRTSTISDVTLSISCLPRKHEEDPKAYKQVPHFQHYYKMVSDPPDDLPYPVRRNKMSPSGFSIRPVRCTPVWIEP